MPAAGRSPLSDRTSSPEYHSNPPVLKDVYEKPERHAKWESVYRDDPLLDPFNDAIMDRLLREMNPPPNGLVLDAGCGVGDHALRIAKRGYKCVGTDISQFILKQAEQRLAKSGKLAGELTFVCQPLEQLSFPDNTFDAIHCRGVLMHIPDWERGLANLCRVLKPGGSIAIMESNANSPQAFVTSALRFIAKGRRRVKYTPAGVEFWKSATGGDFLIRTANMKYLRDRLTEFHVVDIRRFCTSFLSAGMFPAGTLRNVVVHLNRRCFSLGFPPSICQGNAIVGEKLP